MATVSSLTKLAVQWQVGNQCNYRCDYCHPNYHDGSNPFLSYENFQTAITNLSDSVSHDLIIIEFQGGEPSICVPVRDALIEPPGRFKYVISTNASQSIDWWRQAVNNLVGVILSYHPEYCSPAHFRDVVSVVKDSGIEYSITINAHPKQERWQDAVAMYEELKHLPTQLRALFANHERGNNKFFDYTKEQWDYYTLVNNIHPPKEEPVETQIKWVEQRLYNNYKGHLCWAGVDQIVIDYFGYAYRGWCHAHGSLGNVFEGPITMDTKPKVCPYTQCKNAFDLQAKKSENSWGL